MYDTRPVVEQYTPSDADILKQCTNGTFGLALAYSIYRYNILLSCTDYDVAGRSIQPVRRKN